LRLAVIGSLLAVATLLSTMPGEADRGVGVSTGEMTIETLLSPGASYSLPTIAIINTGDEPSEYRVSC